MEGLARMADRERKGEKCRGEEICGEIIIPGVTVAAFFEVDVNKILSYTQSISISTLRKRCCGGSGGRGKTKELCAHGRNTSAHTHKHISVELTARRWLTTCPAYRLTEKHILACSHLTCQNSRAPCLLAFGFSGFELLK